MPFSPAASVLVKWTTTFSDLPGVQTVSIKRGRNHGLGGKFDAGECTVTLDNRDRRYDPLYTDGPYGANLKPMKAISVFGGFNMLTEVEADFEGDPTFIDGADSTTGTWTGSGCTVSQVTGGDGTAHRGALTSTGGGDIYATVALSSARPVLQGQTYTFMASLRAASTGRVVTLGINWLNASGTFLSESTHSSLDNSSSWSRLSMGAKPPTNAAFAYCRIQVLGTAASEVHYIDRAGLFSGVDDANWDAGLQIYATPPTWYLGSWNILFNGFIESIATHRDSEVDSSATITAHDIFKSLSYKNIRSLAYYNAVLALSPSVFLRLDEKPPVNARNVASGPVYFDRAPGGTANGNSAGAVQRVDGPLVEDPSFGIQGSVDKGSAYIPTNGALTPGEHNVFSIVFWMQTSATGVNVGFPSGDIFQVTALPIIGYDNNDGSVGLVIWLGLTPWTGGNQTVLYANVNASTSGPHQGVFTDGSTNVVNDGKWHHIAFIRDFDGTMYIYVDGVAASTSVDLGSTPGTTATSLGTLVALPGTGGGNADIAMKDLAVWSAVRLTATDVANLYNDGVLKSDTVLNRLKDIINLIGINVPTVGGDAGPTLRAFTDSLVNTAALDHMQTCADSDGGTFFVDALGVLWYYTRNTTRASASSPFTNIPGNVLTTSRVTFSDNTDTATLPYVATDSPVIDDLDIYNEISIQGPACGSVLLADSTSQTSYGVRTHSRTVELLNATDATGVATDLLNRYKQPVVRIPPFTWQPAASPFSGYTYAAKIDLMNLVTYEQRSVGGTSLGFVTGRVESIEQTINIPNDLWTLVYGLSAF